MTLQLQFAGQLVTGPASSDTTFPGGVSNIPLLTNPSPRPYNVTTGDQAVMVNSPSSFVTLPGIGGTVGVTQATFLLMRVNVPMQIRLTFSGDATPKVFYVGGLFGPLETDPSKPITLVEVQGSGTVEYLATGNQ